jgi:hypothetical protein
MFERVILILTMINQRNSRISLATLILCLCLGSMIILPFIQVSPSAPEISRIDAENYGLFVEFDDDFFVISIVGVTIAEPGFSNSRPVNLGFRPVSLSPVSPPPKHA